MVRGTFSPARAWRHAAGASLPRTLGHAKRRSASSIYRAQPQMQPVRSTVHHQPSRLHAWVAQVRMDSASAECGRQPYKLATLHQTHHAVRVPSTPWSVRGARFCSRSVGTSMKRQSVGLRPGSPWWRPRTGQAAAGKSGQARYGACLSRMPRAKGDVHHRPQAMVRWAWPNPSFKRSANGRPPAPGRWYAVQFHRPGAGVLPSSPA